MSLIKIVNSSDLRTIIHMSEAIESMRKVYGLLDSSSINLLDRTILGINNNYALVMPSHLADLNALSVKISTITPGNISRGLPLIDAIVVFVNTSSGQIEMLVEGKSLTAMRTGAMCGLATSLAAPATANSMAVIGAGFQARSVIDAICEVRNIKHIKIFSRTAESSIKLKNEIYDKFKSISVDVVSDPNHAVENVDIICTCTSNSSNLPVFSNCNLKNGVHINAIGGPGVNSIELPIDLYKNSRVIVEHKQTAKRESGEIKLGYEKNYIDDESIINIGSIINNKVTLNNNKQFSIFRSVGMAIQDTALATKIYEKSFKHDLSHIDIN